MRSTHLPRLSFCCAASVAGIHTETAFDPPQRMARQKVAGRRARALLVATGSPRSRGSGGGDTAATSEQRYKIEIHLMAQPLWRIRLELNATAQPPLFPSEAQGWRFSLR